MEQKSLVDTQETEMVDPLLKEGSWGERGGATQKGTLMSILKTSWHEQQVIGCGGSKLIL